MLPPIADTGRAYHTQCTGNALETAKARDKDEDITLFGSCFSPFVQRVWVALEVLGIPYKYYEVDPYKKPKELLEVSPKGLIPALKLNRYKPARSLNESPVIIEFLEELAATTTKRSMLPPIIYPYARALVRLQADHINHSLAPAYYRYLLAQTEEKQIETRKDFHGALEGLITLLELAERDLLNTVGVSGECEARMRRKGLGVWIPGQKDLGWTDIMAGPFLFRAKVVLTYYRGYQMPHSERFDGWLERLFNHPSFKATCSTEQLYLDSNERYAFNRPNASMRATAINEGRACP